MQIQLLRAQSKHCQFIYDLYTNTQVMRGHGLHKPIPAHVWRDVITGIVDGWQHIYVIHHGVLPVGHIGFQFLSKEDRRAEMVITVSPQHHRRGIGYLAVEQAMELAFTPFKNQGLGLEQLWVGIVEDNVASQALFTKAGFEQSGEIRDYFRYGPKQLSRRIYGLSITRYKELE